MTALFAVALILGAPTRLVIGLDGPDLRLPAAARRVDTVVRALGGQSKAREVRRLSFALVLDVPDAAPALSTVRGLAAVRWTEIDVRIPVQIRSADRAADPLLPDDPLYPEQWHLHPTDEAVEGTDINVEPAWQISLGEMPGGGAVRVAVLDDGFDLAHPDLLDRFAPDGLDVSSQDHIVDSDPSYDPLTHDYHGTQTAGVVAATAFNLTGVAGVCPACELLPVRLIGGGGGPADLFTDGSAAAQAIEWAVDNGADVINNSWGPDDRDRLDPTAPSELWPVPRVVQEAIRRAATDGRGGLGCVITWAAGNGAELATYDRFASDPRAIAVGSIDAFGRLASYSDFGPTVSLVAPSSGDWGAPKIWTTDVSGIGGVSASDYSSQFGGTSASSAMVAGVAALVIAAFPELTAAQVTEALLESAYPVDPQRGDYDETGRSALYGYGRVDAHAALLLAQTYDGPYTHGLEICDNGRDDNGDGQTDELPLCADPCMPTTAGRETCDGTDDNCDGRVDEGFVCEPTDRPVCAPCTSSSQCAADLRCHVQEDFLGSWCLPACDSVDACPHGFDGQCTSGVCSLVLTDLVRDCNDLLRCHLPERCDGLDNDCNGTVDDVDPSGLEAQTVQASCRGVGVCSQSTATCSQGRWHCANPAAWQEEETLCDGLDNDCDGQRDEAARCEQASRGGGCWGCRAGLSDSRADVTLLVLLVLLARGRARQR